MKPNFEPWPEVRQRTALATRTRREAPAFWGLSCRWSLLTFLSRVLRSVVVVAVARKLQAPEHSIHTGSRRPTTDDQEPASSNNNQWTASPSFGWLKTKCSFGSPRPVITRPPGRRGVYVTAFFIRWIFFSSALLLLLAEAPEPGSGRAPSGVGKSVSLRILHEADAFNRSSSRERE